MTKRATFIGTGIPGEFEALAENDALRATNAALALQVARLREALEKIQRESYWEHCSHLGLIHKAATKALADTAPKGENDG